MGYMSTSTEETNLFLFKQQQRKVASGWKNPSTKPMEICKIMSLACYRGWTHQTNQGRREWLLNNE